MTAPFDPVQALRVLTDAGVRFIVIGQLAAVIHGHPESTVDLDVVVQRDIDNAERIVEALDRVDAVVIGPDGQPLARPPDERDFLGWHQAVQTDTAVGPIDIMPFAIGVGDYDVLLSNAKQVDIDGISVAVAAIDDVIASKQEAGRPKDLSRLPSLRAFAARLAADPDTDPG